MPSRWYSRRTALFIVCVAFSRLLMNDYIVSCVHVAVTGIRQRRSRPTGASAHFNVLQSQQPELQTQQNQTFTELSGVHRLGFFLLTVKELDDIFPLHLEFVSTSMLKMLRVPLLMRRINRMRSIVNIFTFKIRPTGSLVSLKVTLN